MNYGKVADALAFIIGLAAAIGTVTGVVIFWTRPYPTIVKLGMTLLVAAVAALMLFAELDRRQRR